MYSCIVPSTTKLHERWKEAREAAGLGVNELGRIARLSQGVASRAESGEQEPGLDIIVRAAEAMGVTAGWLAFGEEPRARGSKDAMKLLALSANSFVSRLLRLPKLVGEVERRPQKAWKVGHLVGLVHDLVDEPTLATADGDPTRGTWADLLDEKAGRVPPGNVVGRIDRFRELVSGESSGVHPKAEPPQSRDDEKEPSTDRERPRLPSRRSRSSAAAPPPPRRGRD